MAGTRGSAAPEQLEGPMLLFVHAVWRYEFLKAAHHQKGPWHVVVGVLPRRTAVVRNPSEFPSVMAQAGFAQIVGADNVCPNIEAALARARMLPTKTATRR
jgi:hypothetical protein